MDNPPGVLTLPSGCSSPSTGRRIVQQARTVTKLAGWKRTTSFRRVLDETHPCEGGICVNPLVNIRAFRPTYISRMHQLGERPG
ncbi:MAG: hypothetical protein GYA12_12470 [Chloroflexi bacterium]|nr:hypothetical protein [Chloroflexota bacterium]